MKRRRDAGPKARWVRRQLRTAARALREECPTAGELPIRLRFSKIPYNGKNSLAWCDLRVDRKKRPRHYTIVIRTTIGDYGYPGTRRATYVELRDSLIHEWAHAMSWTKIAPGCSDHGPEFGVAYSRAYNAVCNE